MSRVAKVPVVIPANVEITIAEQQITVKGPKGSLTHTLHPLVSVKKADTDNNKLEFGIASDAREAWAQAGTARSLVNNMVTGVTTGFNKGLELVGVGYRANAKGKILELSLGYSHPIKFEVPEGVTAETPTVTSIFIKGIDKQVVGQVAAKIRAYRSPEPYKGKGVKYVGEVVARKEAKKK